MLKRNVEDLMNAQIANELDAAHKYLSMSAYLESITMPGFAHWMRIQANEELEHAMKFYNHIIERGGRVRMSELPAPPVEFESPLQVAELALAHEEKVTGQIYAIYDLAVKENDYAVQTFLHWFVDEQVEEELSATTLIEKLKMVGDSKAGLYMLDKELAAREAE
jgi:ferritin